MFLYNLTLQKAGAVTVCLITFGDAPVAQKCPRSGRPRLPTPVCPDPVDV